MISFMFNISFCDGPDFPQYLITKKEEEGEDDRKKTERRQKKEDRRKKKEERRRQKTEDRRERETMEYPVFAALLGSHNGS